MFKSRDRQTDKDVIILDACWNNETIHVLRSKSQKKILVCPVCQQPVRVKAGKIKRWHFAHQDVSHCPLGHESPAILDARSLLYTWLNSKYPNKVTVEKTWSEYDVPRPIDCYVEIGAQRTFGYWILETGLRSREPFIRASHLLNISLTWLFLSNMLRLTTSQEARTANLTPTEREFAYSSEYNRMYSSHDTALNYLNIEDQTLTTLRGLWCVHSPQEYAFHVRLVETLEHMLISRKTGEFIYPGEYEKLQKYKEQQRKLQEEARQRRNNDEKKRQHFLTQQKSVNTQKSQEYPAGENAVSKVQEPDEPQSIDYLKKRYTCRVCGAVTQNWIRLDLSTNTCICSRECLQKSHENVS